MTAGALSGIAAGILSFVAYGPYILSIFRGKTIPSRTSWWIWSLVGFLILASYYGVGARNTIWIPLVFFLCPFTIAVLSLKFGTIEKLNKLDKVCLALAVLSSIFWIFLDSPSVTLFINIGIDLIGFLPTFRKSFYDPEHENRLAWVMFSFGSALNILAVEKFSLSVMIYPIYMMAADMVMLLFLFRPHKYDSRNIS